MSVFFFPHQSAIECLHIDADLIWGYTSFICVMWSWPGPWAADRGRRGCSLPTPQQRRAAWQPARRCSQCPSGCCPACTGHRSGSWGRVQPAAAERWSPTGKVAHCRGLSRWSGTVPGCSESQMHGLAVRLPHIQHKGQRVITSINHHVPNEGIVNKFA